MKKFFMPITQIHQKESLVDVYEVWKAVVGSIVMWLYSNTVKPLI